MTGHADIDAVREELGKRRAADPAYLRTVGKRIGYARPTLSLFLRGKYQGNCRGIAEELAALWGWSEATGSDATSTVPTEPDHLRETQRREQERVQERVRRSLNEYLAGAPRGEAKKLADEAGISPTSVSLFRSGKYCGDARRVAAKLGEALKKSRAARLIGSGEARPLWLVNTRKSLRLVGRWETVERIRAAEPDAHVVQVWRGSAPHDLGFMEVE
jgi:DNA transposition AAA+ family ATPase